MDYYKNYKNLENSFIEFINKTPPTGKAVICLDNYNIRKIIKKIRNKNIITYGERLGSNYQIKNIKYNFDSTTFNLNFKDKEKKIELLKI